MSQAITEAEARAIVTPWYSLFTMSTRGDVRAVFDRVTAPDFQSCIGDLPGEIRDRESAIQLIGGLGRLIPDMVFEIKELLVAGDKVVVRGESTGTPAGELFGAPHTGRSFRIMSIDILSVANGKITRSYHLENWLAALNQLRA